MTVHAAGYNPAGPLSQLLVALVCSGHMEASRSTPILDRVKDWRGLATAQDAILCHGMPVQQVGSGESVYPETTVHPTLVPKTDSRSLRIWWLSSRMR